MKISKELKEWGIILVVFSVLYVTGWYKNVAGFLQGLILETGIMTAQTIEEEKRPLASYDLRLIDVDGQIMDLNDLKGKVIFMNYWATWCPPCIAEMPDINDLYNKVKGDHVAFVMISLDEDFDKAIKYVNKKEFDFPIYQLASQRPRIYQSNSIPSTYVISSDGKLIAKRSGMAKYDTEEFRALLRNN